MRRKCWLPAFSLCPPMFSKCWLPAFSPRPLMFSKCWLPAFSPCPTVFSKCWLPAFYPPLPMFSKMLVTSIFSSSTNVFKNAAYQHFLLFHQCFQKCWLPAFSPNSHSNFSFTGEFAKPHSSVSNVADLRTGGCWCNPQLGQYSFRSRIDVSNSFLSHHCPLFHQWLCGKPASGLERILCGVLV